MKQIYLLVFLLGLIPGLCSAQYPPQAGLVGSDAISATSTLFVGWATQCTLQRGYMDIANPSLGYTSSGDSSLALGAADDMVVSMGDSGVAVLTFLHPIFDGPGPDFAVFENGFRNPTDSTMAFLELAFVEVSSDGINFFRFPATSLTQAVVQIPGSGVYMDATKINNLAGKYIAGFGTPFDLHLLAGVTGLDLNHITHIRIVDVVGAIGSHATKDSAGRIINDPYPTPFPTGGFDLDAVGVINQVGTGIKEVNDAPTLKVFPNPATDIVNIRIMDSYMGNYLVILTSATGYVLQQLSCFNNSATMVLTNYPIGIYLLTITDTIGNKWVEKITKY